MEYELVENFFTDLADYMHFFLKLKEAGRATPDGKCVAFLKKEDNKYLYTLQWEGGKFVGEYIQPFRPNEENLQLFHKGCAEMARRMRIYLETGDAKRVPTEPPVFGSLASGSPENSTQSRTSEKRVNASRKYFPQVRNARLVKQYDVNMYDVELLTDVQCSGVINCVHLLVASKKGTKEAIYVIAAEVNNLSSQSDGSHFLCCYPGSGHINRGCSDDWGHLSRFEREACELMNKELGIQIAYTQYNL